MSEKNPIPMVDLKAQYRVLQHEIDPVIAGVIESAAFVRGADCTLLEEEFAAYCGVEAACGVANGTDALTLALKAYGVGPGDEVVTVANTFIATGEAILLTGARPVFIDVDPVSFTMNPALLEAALTDRTKVILPVHLYGQPADMQAITRIADRHGLPVLEDAAQAHGADVDGVFVGRLGHAACFSFYPGKNLGAYGDAGMVVSRDRDFIAKVRQIANHGGGANKYDNVIPGTNSRLDTLQAAVLRVKLRHLDEWNAARAERAAEYERCLEGIPGLELPKLRPGARSAWHLYTILATDRDALQARLKEEAISSAVHYPRPIHLQPAMAAAGGQAGDLPVSEGLSTRVLSLPLYPELPMEAIARVVSTVRDFCQAPAH